MEAEKGNGANSNNSVGGNDPVQSSTMKFTFTASKTKFSASRPPLFPRAKQRGDDVERKDVELVTGFDEQGIVAKNPKGLRGARVIPSLENSWRPEKRMKNIIMETDVMTISSSEDRFEKEEPVLAGSSPGVKYGLIAGIKKVDFERLQVTDHTTGGQDPTADQNMEEQKPEQGTRPLTLAQLESEALRRDLVSLPDQADDEAYEAMPIADFGKALLRGQGWDEGKPIGRNCAVAVQPVEYVRRTGRTGLGAEPAPRNANDHSNRYTKPGQSRVPTPDLVASTGQDGRVRNVVNVGEKLVERSRKGVAKGKVMFIISGRHMGLRGEVLDSGNSDRVSVKLNRSGEKIVVNAKDLADIGSLEEEKVVKQIRQLEIGNGGISRRGHGREAADPRSPGEDEKGVGGKDRREAEREKGSRLDEKTEKHGSREEEKLRSKRDGGRKDEAAYGYDGYTGERSRSHDRRASSRGEQGQERREEVRKVETKREGRKEDDRTRREQGRRLQDRDERTSGTDRKLGYKDDAAVQGRVEKERVDALARDSNGDTGRYRASWLTSQIRVRIISKTLKGGRLYLKKARVVDVVTPTECDLLLDETGEILQHVRQDQLETALPKRGGRIMVVGGKQRGLLGKLIERDSEGEVGLVQMEESFEMVTIDLDLLAEYVGDVLEARH